MSSMRDRFLAYMPPLYNEDKELKRNFYEWYESSKLIQIRAVTILTAILYIFYALIDYAIAPGCVLSITIPLHLYIMPIFLFIIAALTFSKKYHKIMIFLLIVAPISAAMINQFIALNIKDVAIYLPEIYLIIIWTFAISGLRLTHAAISASIIFILVIAINYYLFPMRKELFLMHFLWMISSFSFGLLSAFILENSSKTIFLKNKKLEYLAITDKLTCIHNRFKIENVLSREIDLAQRYGRTFSIILSDIDNFKSVNDIYGHITGDAILREFSKLLQNGIRKVDIVGRWGGEEFLIILPETTLREAKKVAEYLREKVEKFEFMTIKNKTGSFGVTQYEQNDTIESIVNRADIALYRAKDDGRNRVVAI